MSCPITPENTQQPMVLPLEAITHSSVNDPDQPEFHQSEGLTGTLSCIIQLVFLHVCSVFLFGFFTRRQWGIGNKHAVRAKIKADKNFVKIPNFTILVTIILGRCQLPTPVKPQPKLKCGVLWEVCVRGWGAEGCLKSLRVACPECCLPFALWGVRPPPPRQAESRENRKKYDKHSCIG